MKKKIAVIGAKGFPAFGGSSRANEQLFDRLKIEYDVTIYALEGFASKEYDNPGIRQIILSRIGGKKLNVFIYYIKSTLHALLKGNYNIIHVNHSPAGYIIPFLRLRYPVVFNVRGFFQHKKFSLFETKLLMIFGELGYLFSNYIITVEKYSTKFLNRRKPGKVCYLPNGVDINKHLEDIKGDKKIDITFASGRIIETKGLHLLLNALKSIDFGIKLRVIGDLKHNKSYNLRINNMVKMLNNKIDVEFIDIIKNKDTLFKTLTQTKFFVFPSLVEGMSNMLLEVASLKIPIIASNIPQNTDVFENDEVLFFDVSNADDLKNKLLFAFDNYDILIKMSDKAHKKIIKNHNWGFIAKKYSSIYDDIINK